MRTLAIQCDEGMCNRFEVIFSYLDEARARGEQLVVVWPVNRACPGWFLDYFHEIPDVKFVDQYDGYRYFHGYQCIEERKLEMIAKYLIPREWICEKVSERCKELGDSYIALHVRRTDKIAQMKDYNVDLSDESFNLNWLDQQPKDVKIFLATDNADSQQFYKEKYGERIYLKPISSSDNLRQTSLEDAIVDLLVCVKAKAFQGTCGSSFSMIIETLRKFSYEYKRETIKT